MLYLDWIINFYFTETFLYIIFIFLRLFVFTLILQVATIFFYIKKRSFRDQSFEFLNVVLICNINVAKYNFKTRKKKTKQNKVSKYQYQFTKLNFLRRKKKRFIIKIPVLQVNLLYLKENKTCFKYF